MMSARGNRDFGTKKPVWQSDASARWLALLPELVLSIVATTCMSVLLCYPDVEDFGLLVVAMLATQVYVQVVLYACTYIARDARLVNLGWLIVVASMYVFSMPVSVYSGFDTNEGSLAFMVSIAMMAGIFLFYFTRPRWGIVLLALEMVAIAATSNYGFERLVVCLVGFGGLLALYVMRGSAVRITRPFFDEGWHMASGGDADARPSSLRGIDGQVVAFAVAVGALCVAVALVGVPLFGASGPGSDVSASPSGETQVTEAASAANAAESASATGTTQESRPGETSGGGVSSAAAEGSAVTNGSSAEAADSADAAGGGEGREGSRGAIPVGLLGILLLPAAVALSFCVRLFKRRLARRSIEREPREIDRVAKVYLAIVSRLEAAGIERRKAETPREFLVVHGSELEELTVSDGFGLDEWTALTDAYENARYANRGPVDSELEMSWKLYDALPACARRALGLPRYLAGPFWRM